MFSAIIEKKIPKLDLVELRVQYQWLLSMPNCEQKEGLLNLIEYLLDIE